jgi:hypothetical protein
MWLHCRLKLDIDVCIRVGLSLEWSWCWNLVGLSDPKAMIHGVSLSSWRCVP